MTDCASVARAFAQRPIAFHPVFIDITGSVEAALALSQLVYWAQRMGDKPFWKTDDEIRRETRLSRWQWQSAKRTLKELDFLIIERKGMPAKTWYRIDWNGLAMAAAKHAETGDVLPEVTECLQTSSQDVLQTRCKDALSTSSQDVLQTVPYTETTTETTAKNFSLPDGREVKTGVSPRNCEATPHRSESNPREKPEDDDEALVLEPPQPSSDGKAKRVKDQVPYHRIIALYHEILPELPRVVKLTETRKRHIRARWTSGDLPTLEDWREYFEIVRKSRFLMGRADGTNGRPPFRANLDWLIRETNAVNVVEGKYL